MTFTLNYNDGYEVCAIMWSERYGHNVTQPLRNFGDRQGDAKIFQLHDCPHLPYDHIRLLAKKYNPAIKYHRISERQFQRTNQ